MTQTIDMSNIYEELKRIEKIMVTKAEMNRFLETFAVMSNEDTMGQIRQSEQDIIAGRIKKVTSTADL